MMALVGSIYIVWLLTVWTSGGFQSYLCKATGSAFVTYHNSGDRDFIFNIKNAACGKLSAQHVDENILKDCTHFKFMGSSLFSFHMVDAVKKAVTIVKANGGVISFDPNIRKVCSIFTRDALHFVLELHIYMPSEGEVLLCRQLHTGAAQSLVFLKTR